METTKKGGYLSGTEDNILTCRAMRCSQGEDEHLRGVKDRWLHLERKEID